MVPVETRTRPASPLAATNACAGRPRAWAGQARQRKAAGNVRGLGKHTRMACG